MCRYSLCVFFFFSFTRRFCCWFLVSLAFHYFTFSSIFPQSQHIPSQFEYIQQFQTVSAFKFCLVFDFSLFWTIEEAGKRVFAGKYRSGNFACLYDCINRLIVYGGFIECCAFMCWCTNWCEIMFIKWRYRSVLWFPRLLILI